MKTLKITLALALLFTMFTSCTKQDLNEDDVLGNESEEQEMPFTGGSGHD